MEQPEKSKSLKSLNHCEQAHWVHQCRHFWHISPSKTNAMKLQNALNKFGKLKNISVPIICFFSKKEINIGATDEAEIEELNEEIKKIIANDIDRKRLYEEYHEK